MRVGIFVLSACRMVRRKPKSATYRSCWRLSPFHCIFHPAGQAILLCHLKAHSLIASNPPVMKRFVFQVIPPMLKGTTLFVYVCREGVMVVQFHCSGAKDCQENSIDADTATEERYYWDEPTEGSSHVGDPLKSCSGFSIRDWIGFSTRWRGQTSHSVEFLPFSLLPIWKLPTEVEFPACFISS